MPSDPSFRMTVQDVFSIRRRGTIVTGQIEQGTLQVGDIIKIWGPGYEREAIVAGVEMFHKRLKMASVGDNVGVVLQDVEKDKVRPGDILEGTGLNAD